MAAATPSRLQLLGLAGAVVVVGLVGVGLVTIGGGGSTSAPGTPVTATAAPVPTVTATPVAGLAAVPGATATGITDPGALTRHRNASLQTSHTLWVDLYWRPANESGGWHQRDIDIRVAGSQSLLQAEVEPANETARRPVLSVYRDGDARYVASYAANGSTRVRVLSADERSPSRVPAPMALRARTPRGLLTTATTTFTGRVRREGESYFRFVAQGTPAVSLPRPGGPAVAPDRVRNYTAVVLVDQAGRIDTIEARYTLPASVAARTVRFSITYDRVGRTTVSRPDWVDSVNGNATAMVA
ncbi:hypothetical protein [Halosegnis sp.]|uniref:hypothetical protein n=1 Tax=Halosegnis sp. TaxID=2864959 RepID=UPI0035D4768C